MSDLRCADWEYSVSYCLFLAAFSGIQQQHGTYAYLVRVIKGIRILKDIALYVLFVEPAVQEYCYCGSIFYVYILKYIGKLLWLHQPAGAGECICDIRCIARSWGEIIFDSFVSLFALICKRYRVGLLRLFTLPNILVNLGCVSYVTIIRLSFCGYKTSTSSFPRQVPLLWRYL